MYISRNRCHKKKIRLENDIVELNKNAEKLYERAETTQKIEFVSQGNAMKRVAKEKEILLKDINETLKSSVDSLKDL